MARNRSGLLEKDWLLVKSLARWEDEGGSLGVDRDEPAALTYGGKDILHGPEARDATPVDTADVEVERFHGLDDPSVFDRHLAAVAEAAIVDGAPQGP